MIDADELPGGWAVARVGEIAASIQSGFACGAHNREGRGTIHLRPMNITADGLLSVEDVRHIEGECPHKVEADDVLFNNTNSAELVGKTTLIRESSGYAFSNHMTRIRCKSVIEPAFLAIQLNTMFRSGYFQTRCNNHVSQASISASYLREEVELAIPPLSEQRRIVAKIEELTARSRAARAALAEVPTLLEQYRQSVLASAFRGDLTADWRAKNPDTEPASVLLSSGIPLPEGEQRRRKVSKQNAQHVEIDGFGDAIESWAYQTVQELYDACAIVDYADGNHGSLYPRKEEFGSEGAVFITAQQIQDGCIEFDIAPRLKYEKANQITKGWAKGGDVLLTHNATVGRTARVPDGRGRFLLGTSATYYRPNPLVLDSDFLYLALTAPQWQQQLTSVMEQTTRNQVSIQKQAFFVLPLPPLTEQKEIVGQVLAKLATIRQIELDVERSVADVNQLDQSILAKAFRGELVPQDPADEPASALLARIRSGSSMTTPTTTTRSAKRGQVRAYILLLLRTWNKPLGREMLERGLVLMLNADVRRAILGRSKTTPKPTKKNSPPPQFVGGMDMLLGEMIADRWLVPGPEAGFFAEGRHGIDLAAAPPSDLDAVRETAEAMKVLHKDRQQATDADIVSALNGEIYELVY